VSRTNFIHINDISEINTAKISIYDLNKRFIDSKGNMYGLKYNREFKKVEIIRVFRTTTDRVDNIKKKIVDNKKADYLEKKKNIARTSDFEENSTTTENNYNQNDNSPADKVYQDGDEFFSEDYEEPTKDFFPDVFLERMFKELKLHSDRIKGIISNIHISNLITHQDKDFYIRLEEIIRNLEIDGYKKTEKIIDIHRELKDYPRSLNYYIGKIDTKGKEIVSKIMSEEKKFKFVLYYEMNVSITDFYKSLRKILHDTEELIDKVMIVKQSSVNKMQKLKVVDAKTSISNTIAEIDGILNELKKFRDYIYNANNFFY